MEPNELSKPNGLRHYIVHATTHNCMESKRAPKSQTDFSTQLYGANEFPKAKGLLNYIAHALTHNCMEPNGLPKARWTLQLHCTCNYTPLKRAPKNKRTSQLHCTRNYIQLHGVKRAPKSQTDFSTTLHTQLYTTAWS